MPPESRLAPAGTGAPRKQTENDDREPRWKKWRLMPEVRAWEAVALSLNIEPTKIRTDRNAWMGLLHPFDEGDEFNDRLTVLLANLSNRAHFPTPSRINMEAGFKHGVKLAEFAAFAAHAEWDVPADLAALSPKQQQVDPAVQPAKEEPASGCAQRLISENQAEYDAAWWDAEVGASEAWGAESLTPQEAAMALCGFKPFNTSPEEAERVTTPGETTPEDYKRLLFVFEAKGRAEPRHRTLGDWLAIAKSKQVKYHSWIDTWLAATRQDTPAVPMPSAEAAETNQPSAAPPDNVVRHTLTKGKSVPLSAEVSQAKSLAVDSDDTTSVWAEIVKLAEKGVGSLIGQSSDGVQYRGAKYQATGEPDVFTLKNLRDRMKRAKARKGA